MGDVEGADVGNCEGADVGNCEGASVGPAPVGAGVLTGLNALCANTPLGKLTAKITGAAQAAWTTARFVMPPSFFSAASAELSSLRTCSRRASSSASAERGRDLAFFGSFLESFFMP